MCALNAELNLHRPRTKQTEILYIFFGIHTANVVQLVRKKATEAIQVY